MKELIKKLEKELSCSAHDIDHTMRVYNLCLELAKNEKVNMDVLQASALLHDIARIKEDNDVSGKTDHAVEGAKMALNLLGPWGLSEAKIKAIQHCIKTHRFRTSNKPKSIEAKILFDADKLDALGAIGIARSYVWVGKINAKLYTDVDLKKYIKENLSGSPTGRIKDKRKHSPQIEYETKHKFLAGKLYTKQGKKIAKERTKFYKDFLERLQKEINGKL